MTKRETTVLDRLEGAQETLRKRRADILAFRNWLDASLLDATKQQIQEYLDLFPNYNTRRRILASLRTFYVAAGKDLTAGIGAPKERPPAIEIRAERADRFRVALFLMLAASSLPTELMNATIGEVEDRCKADPRLYRAFQIVYEAGQFQFPWDDRADSNQRAFPDAERLRVHLADAGFELITRLASA